MRDVFDDTEDASPHAQGGSAGHVDAREHTPPDVPEEAAAGAPARIEGSDRMPPVRSALPVLWRDTHHVVVYKPAGLVDFRTRDVADCEHFAMDTLRMQLGCRVYVVHRLERSIAGLMLFVTHLSGVRPMLDQFRGGLVRRRLLAIVRGHLNQELFLGEPGPGVVEEAGQLPVEDATQRAVRGIAMPIAQAEVPHPMGRNPTTCLSLIEIVQMIESSHHQIPRNLRRGGFALIGDTTHGDRQHNRLFRERFKSRRPLLCSVGLSYTHPISGEPREIRCAPDADFLRVMTALGWGDTVRVLLEEQPRPDCDAFASCRPDSRRSMGPRRKRPSRKRRRSTQEPAMPGGSAEHPGQESQAAPLARMVESASPAPGTSAQELAMPGGSAEDPEQA